MGKPDENLPELIKNVDAVILARDESESLSLFKRNNKRGIPILIDKQLATNEIDAHSILELERYPGQINKAQA